MPDRPVRDVLGEALRRITGVWSPPWNDIDEPLREGWRQDADRELIARLAEAGYRIVREGD